MLHPVTPATPSHTPWWGWEWGVGGTYYFGHQISEVEAVFGHHRAQDLGDRLGGFGLQAHRSVDGNQVQSGRDGERTSNVNTGDKQKDVMSMNAPHPSST